MDDQIIAFSVSHGVYPPLVGTPQEAHDLRRPCDKSICGVIRRDERRTHFANYSDAEHDCYEECNAKNWGKYGDSFYAIPQQVIPFSAEEISNVPKSEYIERNCEEGYRPAFSNLLVHFVLSMCDFSSFSPSHRLT